MYVSYFEDQENNMYTGSRKYPNSSLPMQDFPPGAAYSDYMGYHGAQTMDNPGHCSGVWGAPYGYPREEMNGYGPGPSTTCSPAVSGICNGQMMYESPDYSTMRHPGQGAMPHDSINIVQTPSNNQRHQSYDWMKKTALTNPTGKTRTKEKYRVVYTDHQRLELEKEFLSNRYITIRRKSEIALSLGLSDRQVKIWFQNRRAKERKLIKKIGQFDGSMGSVQSDSGSVSPADMSVGLYSQAHAINAIQPMGNMSQVAVSQ
ncbi:homeobox protein CDX-4-like [Spea bombifrons]|uniref:homeobox protein CDX-4-like n=1 Tax=Spea bombifrons TaxID=233779 RepID=UPI002349D5E8|nr:homeobox protein CDX-4-like [Spea bombifrons]